jgi:hypothetical protein
MAECQQGFAGHFEVAMRHADRRFFMHAGQKFGLLVPTVVDQRFM